MKNLKFSEEEFTREGFKRCEVTWKEVPILEIVFNKAWSPEWDSFGIATGGTSNNLIGFIYIAANPKDDIDFLTPYREAKTFEEAKENCKKIMKEYLAWINN